MILHHSWGGKDRVNLGCGHEGLPFIQVPIGVVLGLDWGYKRDNGKEKGSCYNLGFI